MNELARRGGRPTFDEVHARLQAAGPATVVSSERFTYTVTAEARDRGRVIEARPRSQALICVHERPEAWLWRGRPKAGTMLHNTAEWPQRLMNGRSR